MKTLFPALAIATACVGCLEVDDPNNDDEQEVITTVVLTFTPGDAGAAVIAKHADPEDDGNPVIDAITLRNNVLYTLTVEFLNELEDPAEDITEEVSEESDEHQVIIYGSGVAGPATGEEADGVITHAYDDEDDNGLPIGLKNRMTPVRVGQGDFKVMLRHLPVENGSAQKTEGLAEQFATGGSAGIPGDIDADVTFPITVE